jgi:hypothetical protein
MDGEWKPRCEPPSDLVRPVGIDPSGITGPTKWHSRGPSWRRVGPGLFVPARVEATIVEQRILEQSTRIRGYGALTAWAALRWRGAAYFTGKDAVGDPLPVPLAVGKACLRPDPAILVVRRQTPLIEWEVVHGVPSAIAARALFDEIIRVGSVRPAVVAIDMASAAGLVTVGQFWTFLQRHIRPRNGVVLARAATLLAVDSSWSPQESWMRLCWVLDAALPQPLCNVPVFDRQGNFLGIPDLLDPVAGVVGEYQGGVHDLPGRRRVDDTRAQRFTDHGLGYFEVAAGQLGDIRTAMRMRQARAEGRFLSPDQRAWTLEQPDWWREREKRRRAS